VTPGKQARVALVTGAGRGLGRAVAMALAADGHPVALSARSERELASVAQEIESAGGRAAAIVADVADGHSVAALMVAVAERLGPPLVVVNNAGAAASHKLAGHPPDLWDAMLATNLSGAFHVTRAAAAGMLEAGWGRIVNIGSVASLTGAKYIAAYTAAKHGLLGLTRAAAAEWVDRGITVNMVAPGYLDTAMTDGTIENIVNRTGRSRGEAAQIVANMSPTHRLVGVDEVVPVVRLLVADEARNITGAVIPIDGGASAFAAAG
jgi:NAD(P)-dependent dehydrogenase (short-subunit alcohol dehydrogenase family)